MHGFVKKAAILAHCKKPLRIAYHLRDHPNNVPCAIIQYMAKQPSRKGMVWVKIKVPSTTVMMFLVPAAEVFTRNRFIRPLVPMSLWREAKKLEVAIVENSREWREFPDA